MELARGKRHSHCREKRCAKSEESKMELAPEHLCIGWVYIALFVLNIPNLFVSQYSRKSHISLSRKERIGTHHHLLISYQSDPGENLEHFKPHMWMTNDILFNSSWIYPQLLKQTSSWPSPRRCLTPSAQNSVRRPGSWTIKQDRRQPLWDRGPLPSTLRVFPKKQLRISVAEHIEL